MDLFYFGLTSYTSVHPSPPPPPPGDSGVHNGTWTRTCDIFRLVTWPAEWPIAGPAAHLFLDCSYAYIRAPPPGLRHSVPESHLAPASEHAQQEKAHTLTISPSAPHHLQLLHLGACLQLQGVPADHNQENRVFTRWSLRCLLAKASRLYSSTKVPVCNSKEFANTLQTEDPVLDALLSDLCRQPRLQFFTLCTFVYCL